MVVWLCAALFLAERRTGQVVMLLGGLLAIVMAYVHMAGKGIGAFAKANGAYSFTVTLLLLGVLGGLCTVLALRELWVSWRPALVRHAHHV